MLSKISKSLLLFLFTVFLQVSCSEKNTLDQEYRESDSTVAAKNLVDPLKKRYHFIRFNIKDMVKYNLYITALKDLARINGGKILTLGNPEDCLERVCKNINVVIEFPSQEVGTVFFESYKKLQPLASQAASDLAYHSAASFQISGIFDESIDGVFYLIANANHLDLPRYLEEYARPTVRLIFIEGGVLMSDDFRTQKCLQGECFEYSVLVRFPSREAAISWYNSPEQQALLPISRKLTVGGSILFSPKQ